MEDMQFNFPWGKWPMRLSQLIPGMSVEHEEILWARKIRNASQLLSELCSVDQREAWSTLTGISKQQLLFYANGADLRRIPGIGYRFILLLRAVETMTVSELSYRNAENLHRQMFQVNLKSQTVLVLPSKDGVQRWITRAKTLPKLITYR